MVKPYFDAVVRTSLGRRVGITGPIESADIGGIETMHAQYKKLFDKGPSRISPFFIPGSLINLASGLVSAVIGAAFGLPSLRIKGFYLAVATLAALGTTRRKKFRGETFIYVMINQPLMVPEIVTAVTLLIFFGIIKQATGIQGIGYVILAHAAFCIPFAYLPIRARLEGMDLSLETAATDLYASSWQTFRFVTLPLLLPGVIAGAMLAFVISLDDVVITEFVKSGGQDTLPTYMLGQMRRQMTPEINAVSTMLLVLTVVLLTAFFFLTRKNDQ